LKLVKILNVLVENALKYTLEGSVEIGCAIELDSMSIFVKDTGIGIAPENHEIIFERFSQEDKTISRNAGGLGIGLSIAKESAQLIKGSISLESEKDKGSTFTLQLPIARKPEQTLMKDSIRDFVSDENVNILIVEDEDLNYLYLETLLKENKTYKVKIAHAKNGEEAVEMCQRGRRYDLVLMDVRMPLMDGIEATKLIKSNVPDLPVIAQTAFASREDKEKAKASGFDAFLAKPINRASLESMLDKFLQNDN
jgi:CheY-like chemotaxis protein/anti-sigma regulatory factor (Ser/Thr protein kinase)